MSQLLSQMKKFFRMKLRYGKESLDVKTYDEEWYYGVEEEVKTRVETEKSLIKEKDFEYECGHENSDIFIEEVEAAVDQSSMYSAPSPLHMLKERQRGGY